MNKFQKVATCLTCLALCLVFALPCFADYYSSVGTGGGGGSGTVTQFTAPAVSWPTWLVPTVSTGTTTPVLTVAAGAIPLSSLAQGGATTGQGIQWNGSTWVPATFSGGGTLTGVGPGTETTVTGTSTVPVVNVQYATSATKTSAFSAAVGQFYKANTAGGTFAVTLPDATTATDSGASIAVALITAGNNLTVNTTSAQTVGGNASGVLSFSNSGQLILFYSDGANWQYVVTALGGSGAVSSVSNSDGSITITPTTGSVVAKLPGTPVANTSFGLNGSSVFGYYPNAVNAGTAGQFSGYLSTGSVLSGLANFNFLNGAMTFGTSSVPGQLILNDGSGHTITIGLPTSAANLIWNLPTTTGANGYCMVTDGAGNLSFAANGQASANTPTSRVVPSYSVPWLLPSGQPSDHSVINNGVYVNYPVSGSGIPMCICTGSDGNLWYTDESTSPNAMVRVTPSGVSTVFTDPTASARPFECCAGWDGNVWWTEATGNFISKITPSGTITQYAITGSPGHGSAICAGPDGNIWFGDNAGNIYSCTPSGTVSAAYTPPHASSSGTFGLSSGPDGSVWLTESNSSGTNYVTKFNTTSHAFTEYTIPTSACGASGICQGADGNMWFIELNGNKIGRCTTTGTITEFTVPTGTAFAGVPQGICAGPDGNLWFAEENAAKIAFVTTTGLFTEYPITGFLRSYFVCAGPDGNMYAPVSNGSGIFSISLRSVSGTRAFTGPVTTVAGTAGNYYWTMPEQGGGYKKVIIVLSGYTNASTSTITFPTAFANTPSVTGNGTTLTISTISTSGITIPASTTQSGTIIVDGI